MLWREGWVGHLIKEALMYKLQNTAESTKVRTGAGQRQHHSNN